MEEENQTTNNIEVKEGITLNRGMRGVYGWTIRLNSFDTTKLVELDNEMKLKFANEEPKKEAKK